MKISQYMVRTAAESARTFLNKRIVLRSSHGDVHREVVLLLSHCQTYNLSVAHNLWIKPEELIRLTIKGYLQAERKYRQLNRFIEADALWHDRQNLEYELSVRLRGKTGEEYLEERDLIELILFLYPGLASQPFELPEN